MVEWWSGGRKDTERETTLPFVPVIATLSLWPVPWWFSSCLSGPVVCLAKIKLRLNRSSLSTCSGWLLGFYDEQAWSKEDQAAVEQHFNRLKEATDRGQVIFAGRTAESLDKTFGIVVFEAKDQQAASEFMNGDPAVVAGLMTAELHPFSVSLVRKTP